MHRIMDFGSFVKTFRKKVFKAIFNIQLVCPLWNYESPSLPKTS